MVFSGSSRTLLGTLGQLAPVLVNTADPQGRCPCFTVTCPSSEVLCPPPTRTLIQPRDTGSLGAESNDFTSERTRFTQVPCPVEMLLSGLGGQHLPSSWSLFWEPGKRGPCWEQLVSCIRPEPTQPGAQHSVSRAAVPSPHGCALPPDSGDV